jgi:hypothetical protein
LILIQDCKLQITKKVQEFNLLIAIVSTEAEAKTITLQLNNEGL